MAGLLRTSYDPVTDAISRLAELGTENRWIVTSGMVAFGIGAIAFAPRLGGRATVALFLAGVASFSVAAFPCTEGCPGNGSFTDVAHVIAAGAFYIAFVATALLVEPRRTSDVVTAVVAAVALALHASGLGPNGLLQRVGLTLLDAWLFVTALSHARWVEGSTRGDT